MTRAARLREELANLNKEAIRQGWVTARALAEEKGVSHQAIYLAMAKRQLCAVLLPGGTSRPVLLIHPDDAAAYKPRRYPRS